MRETSRWSTFALRFDPKNAALLQQSVRSAKSLAAERSQPAGETDILGLQSNIFLEMMKTKDDLLDTQRRNNMSEELMKSGCGMHGMEMVNLNIPAFHTELHLPGYGLHFVMFHNVSIVYCMPDFALLSIPKLRQERAHPSSLKGIAG